MSRARAALVVFALASLAVAGPDVVSAQTAPSAAPKASAAQTSRDGGVIVRVTPKNLARGAPTWDFQVVLDTHSGDLGQDLVKSAVLIDGRGREHAPTAWTGDPPGGHHREGVLSFEPLGSETGSVTLQIRGVGGVAQRSFRWQLGEGAR
jgi:hypothetical protein